MAAALIVGHSSMANSEDHWEGHMIPFLKIRCFSVNIEKYRSAASVGDLIIVNFIKCPDLPDPKEKLKAISVFLEGDAVNTLGTPKYKVEDSDSENTTSATESTTLVFTKPEASCISEWASKFSGNLTSQINLLETHCLD